MTENQPHTNQAISDINLRWEPGKTPICCMNFIAHEDWEKWKFVRFEVFPD